jgi:hypothetical protein
VRGEDREVVAIGGIMGPVERAVELYIATQETLRVALDMLHEAEKKARAAERDMCFTLIGGEFPMNMGATVNVGGGVLVMMHKEGSPSMGNLSLRWQKPPNEGRTLRGADGDWVAIVSFFMEVR